MPVVHQSMAIPHSASNMYQLVNKIEDYALFLPWCKRSEVLIRTEEEVRATLTLLAGGLQKSFSTCNRLHKDKMIEIRLLDGPFRQLQGFWHFEQLAGPLSRVTLDLEFEFSSKLLSLAFSPVFTQVTNTLITAFSERANAIYGVDTKNA